MLKTHWTGEQRASILTHQPLIVILGPTAVGKTGLAIQLAQTIDGEILGADSRQIYTHMDIGTAKPTPKDRAAVPHHLIDIIEPDDNLTLARFQQMAYAAIDDCHARGKIPLLVGGTGQYISAVIEGWSIPEVPPDDNLRTELEDYASENGAEALHERLKKVDPEAAEKIHPNNVRRVVRALEVCIVTGTPISELQRKKPPPYAILELGLTLERPYLYEHADHRIDQMMGNGFLEEVKQLLAMGYPHTLPSMSGLGYAQLAEHVRGELPLEDAIEQTKLSTHDFIRRQFTWFRGHDNGIVWHNMRHESEDSFMMTVINWLNGLDN